MLLHQTNFGNVNRGDGGHELQGCVNRSHLEDNQAVAGAVHELFWSLQFWQLDEKKVSTVNAVDYHGSAACLSFQLS